MSSNYRNRSSKKPKPKPAAPAAPKPDSPRKQLGEYDREQRHPSGKLWNRTVANVISAYGGICHLCGHPGAKQADHVVAYAEGGDDSVSNLRPAHGSAGKQKNPCPVCGINCNNVRGALSLEAGRAKIQRRMGEKPEPKDEGREW